MKKSIQISLLLSRVLGRHAGHTSEMDEPMYDQTYDEPASSEAMMIPYYIEQYAVPESKEFERGQYSDYDLVQISSYDENLKEFQYYDLESGIYCYALGLYDSDGTLNGLDFKAIDYNWDENCLELDTIKVEVDENGDLTSMISPIGETWVFYEYEDLYEYGRYYE